jgi:hypothetical protein
MVRGSSSVPIIELKWDREAGGGGLLGYRTKRRY